MCGREKERKECQRNMKEESERVSDRNGVCENYDKDKEDKDR